MKRTLIAMIGLAAMISVAGSTWASDDTASVRAHRFPLRVKAVLTPAITDTPEPLKFIGPGRAMSTPNGVTLVFDVLDTRGRRGQARFRWDNPLRYRPDRPHFAGRGVAKVRLPHRQFQFRMMTKGTIIRSVRTGKLIITGRFKSIASSADRTRFYGKYIGIER